MTAEPASTAVIEMLWRPGCPFCSRLRRGLARAGIDTVERDIWADPAAAARVRSATGGDETVPTVIVGTQALVNPSVGMVVAAVRAEFPDDAQALVGAVSPGARPQAGGPGWTAAVGLVWLLLALWRPTTTWHLAPVLLAGAWPWVTAWDLRAGDRSGAARLVLAGTVGFAASVLVTVGLSQADLMRGPTLLSFPSPISEALVLAGAVVVLIVLAGLLKLLRTAGVD